MEDRLDTEEIRSKYAPQVAEFSRVTEAYFGTAVEVEKYVGNYLCIQGKAIRVHYRTLVYLTEFYQWRIDKGITSEVEIGADDFEFLNHRVSNGTSNVEAAATIIGVSDAALRYNYKECNDVYQAYCGVLNGRKGKAEEFTWDGYTGSAVEWAKRINVQATTFRNRLYAHGVCYLVFLSRDEYAAVPSHEKRKYVCNKIRKTYTTKSSVQVASVPVKKPQKKPAVKRTTQETISDYNGIVRLVAFLIADSKLNMQSSTEPYFTDSKKFLMNKNGLLEYYLDCITDIDVDACLAELYAYATVGYTKTTVRERRISAQGVQHSK